MFGPHLMLDCYGCDKKRLKNPIFILEFLKKLPLALDMHIIKEPFIVPYNYNPESWDNGGISAIVIIAESHISIHTFPDNDGFMNMDVFSCKEFNIEKATALVKAAFKPKEIEQNLVMRGTHFPKEEYIIKKIAAKQRKDIEKRV